jgi:hypothetical protein
MRYCSYEVLAPAENSPLSGLQTVTASGKSKHAENAYQNVRCGRNPWDPQQSSDVLHPFLALAGV